MAKILSVSKSQISGRIKLSGAKNSALRLQAASLLTDGTITLTHFPSGLSDTIIHNEMLELLGKKVDVHKDSLTLSGTIASNVLIWNKRSIRNTLLIWGALLARTGYSKVPMPGGCQIGNRKFDLHQLVLERFGATVWVEGDYLCAKSMGRLVGTDIQLPFRSTGATENAILCACLAVGRSRIWNPHIRPEILDLIRMLRRMGASITVNGNESIVVDGVDELHGCKHEVIPDNMEALTFLVAAAVTGGTLEIDDFPVEHLEVPLIFLKASGLNIYQGNSSVIIKAGECYPLEISTGSYPGINSDMQPILAVYGAVAKGMSTIVDLRFPDRFGYAEQLKKMGVNTEIIHNQLVIHGGNPIHGTIVTAGDLRAGAALLIAGMLGSGETIINHAEQIERGYENFMSKFTSLGANLRWVE